MDEASLPIAIIAGAAGGGVALLLLIALIVCILLRCRGDRSEKKTVAAADSPMEMVTAREGNSDSGRDTYGDLRLANNEYSSAGLSPSSGDSLSKSEATSGVSGSGGDPHYSPMAMRK